LRLTEIAPYPWIAPPVDSPLYQDLRSILAGIGMTDFKVSFSGGTLASITQHSRPFGRADGSSLFGGVHAAAAAGACGAADQDQSSGAKPRADVEPGASRTTVGRRFRRFIDAEFSNLRTTIMKHEQNSLWRR
jgi:hypothetical protein